MDTTPAPLAGPAGDPHFGILRLFLSDARLAGVIGNDLRHRGLHSVFGISRGESNLLTFVLLLSAASASYETARRLAHTPLPLNRVNMGSGALLVREAAIGVAGPSARAIPGFGMLMTFAAFSGLALPGLRRAARAARAAEKRAREHRIGMYIADMRSVRSGTPD